MLAILFMTMTPALLLLTKKTMMWKSFPPILFFTTLMTLPTMYTPLTSKTLSLFMMKDPLNNSLVILSLWITALMFLASSKINNFSSSSKSFSFWILLLLMTLLFSFSTNNLMTFYIMFESSLIPILILILGWGYQPERLQASFYLLLYTIAASLPLLIAILVISSTTGHLYMFMKWTPPHLSNNLTTMWWIMMNMAFLVKLPLFLAHLWLPKAHVEAPVAGSMILAAVLLKLGGYGLIQSSLLFPPPSTLAPILVMSTALWGAVISSLICLRQTDLKALIAYSSVSHMGLLIAGLMSFSSLGTFGATFMMIAHGLCSSALFSIANMTYESTNTRSLYITKGLALASPYMALWWFLLSATNMATPPSINLLSEILLLTSTLSFAPLSWLFLSLISFLSAAYSLYMYTASQHGPSPQFSNPLSTYTPNNHTTLLLHLLPIILLIAKPDIILS